MLPWAQSPHRPNGISVVSAIFAQLTAHFRRPFSQNCPFARDDLDPHLIRGSLGPWESITQTSSRSFQPFNCAFAWDDLDRRSPHAKVPLAHPTPNPKRYLDRYSRFSTAHRRMSIHFTIGRHFSPQNCLFPWGDPDTHLIHGFLAHGSPQSERHVNNNTNNIFLTRSNTVKLLQGRACWSVEPFFLQVSLLTWQIDRHLDHATRSVTIGRLRT